MRSSVWCKARCKENSRACEHGYLFVLREEAGVLNMFCAACKKEGHAPATWGFHHNYHVILDYTLRV